MREKAILWAFHRSPKTMIGGQPIPRRVGSDKGSVGGLLLVWMSVCVGCGGAARVAKKKRWKKRVVVVRESERRRKFEWRL